MQITSILLPVFNGERYIEETLRSIFCQEDEDFEVLIQDDTSTDRTAEICKAFRDPRIKYARNEKNLGCFGSLNAAAERASGDLLRLFSHDDLMLPGDLCEARSCLTRHPECGAVITDFEKIDEAGVRTGYSHDTLSLSKIPETIEGRDAAWLLLQEGCISGTQSNITVRKEIYRILGGADTGMSFAGDFDLLVRIAIHHGLSYNKRVMSQIRFHQDQLSKHGKSSARLVKRNRELIAIVRYLDKSAVQIQRSVRRKVLNRVYHVQLMHLCLKNAAAGRIEPLVDLIRNIGMHSATYAFCSWLGSLPGRVLGVGKP